MPHKTNRQKRASHQAHLLWRVFEPTFAFWVGGDPIAFAIIRSSGHGEQHKKQKPFVVVVA